MSGAAQLFEHAFGAPPAAAGFSPGRVNLIGEHTDYNGGAVLPTALPLGTFIALSPRSDAQLRVASTGFDGLSERQLGEGATGHWSDYALGSVAKANAEGWVQGGADIALTSTLPMGAGLSSSASLVVGILDLMRRQAKAEADRVSLAMSARAVETDFIGVPCGIMDQMAVALAKPGEALFLDTLTLETRRISLPDDPVVCILHSGVQRKLADGRYAERKAECERAQALSGQAELCRAEAQDLARVEASGDGTAFRRMRHCMTEHARTQRAAACLANGDWRGLGTLMVESHASMRDDFGITTPAIDALVEDAVLLGALGARMTGGGFGGCIVAVVPAALADDWRASVLSRHPAARSVL